MRKLKNQKGFILYYTLLIVGLISLICETCFLVTSNNLKAAGHSSDWVCAYYVADAGLVDAFTQLRAGAPPGALTVNNTSYPVSPTITGSYHVTATGDGGPWPAYNIVSTGTCRTATRRLTLKVKMASFSRYGYFSNTEIDPAWGGNWYIGGMISTGPTHTNGQFNMYGNPDFEGLVTQVNPAVHYWSGPPADNPTYKQGLQTGVPAVAMPNSAAFLNSVSAGAQQSQGLYLTGDSAITFLSDGTMNVTNAGKGWTNQNMPIPANYALFVHNGVASVQGVLKGQLTVGSDTDIHVDGNLVYSTDPRTDPTSTDMLGLVAQNIIKVTDQGPFNIEVDGYLVALNGQFLVNNFWTFAKGDMVQFGGLTSNLPGGLTGLFDPGTGQVVFGYNQLQYYDTRMQNQPPPWFPPLTDAAGRYTYSKISITEG